MRVILLSLILAGCVPRLEVPPHPAEFGTRPDPVPTLVLGYDLDDDGRVDMRVYYRAWFGEKIKRSYHPYRIERIWGGYLIDAVDLDYDMDGIIDVRYRRTSKGLEEQ